MVMVVDAPVMIPVALPVWPGAPNFETLTSVGSTIDGKLSREPSLDPAYKNVSVLGT